MTTRNELKLYGSKKKDEYGRSIATENRDKTYKVCYCFPSTQARDIHQAFENGILTKNTKIIPCEKNPHRRNAIIKQLQKRTQNFTEVIKSEAHSARLDKVLSDGEQIDYMPFDICGNFTVELAVWFYRNQSHFKNGMRLPLTLQVKNTRQSQVLEAIDEATNGKYEESTIKLFKKMKTAFKSDSFLTSNAIKGITSQIYLLTRSMPNKCVYINQISVYRNNDKSEHAEYMMMIDADVYDFPSKNKILFGDFRKIIECYKTKVTKNITLDKPTKIRTKKIPAIKILNAYQLGSHMNLFNTYKRFEDIKPQKRAHIKIQAVRYGLDPETTVAKIRNRINKRG